jgi:hypothetical protein
MFALGCGDDGGGASDGGGTGSASASASESDGETEDTASGSGETTDDSDASGEVSSGGTSADASSGGEVVSGIPVLGDGTHDINNVDVEIISSPDDGLNFPSDLEFKPGVPGELWVTNREDHSIVIYEDAGGANQVADKRQATFDNGPHFLAKPASLAFGDNGAFATAQQERAATQPGDPEDGSFMGPTLWTADIDIFNGGHSSHLDMLHNSPLSSGIAHESENTYWVFDGEHGSLTRYKFNNDHGLGGTDHTDGEIYRYADAQLAHVPSIPSHVVLDGQYVYAADSGNGRIVRLDPSTAAEGNSIIPNYDGCRMAYMDGSTLDTLVDGSALDPELTTPSGLEMHDGILFTTDPLTGRIYGFDMDGNLLDWLDTGLEQGAVMGLAFDEDGNMWVTDAAENQIRKFSPPKG